MAHPPHSELPEGDLTGRWVVLFREGGLPRGRAWLERELGQRAELFLYRVGVAVLRATSEEVRQLVTADGGALISAVEPERYVYALGLSRGRKGPPRHASAEYLRGWRDCIAELSQQLSDLQERALEQEPMLAVGAGPSTWNLERVRASRSPFTGKGVRIAVLDTGFGPHPDFAARPPTALCFVEGEEPVDGHGHGTHCAGLIGGPAAPGAGPRYAVAPDAELFTGKVLSDCGESTDAAVLAGIDWALAHEVDVVSLSLGAHVRPGEAPSSVYEEVARRVLARGCLMVAAAGNDGGGPVVSPANCPSVFAVGAVDEDGAPRPGGVEEAGAEVNAVAPGVRILSAWPRSPGLWMLSGSSLAAPHVAGLAALWIEKTGARGEALWRLLEETARPLPAPHGLVGAGLVQAPLA